MALYWVSYDLDKPGQDYTDLINRLRQWKATRILKSDWLLPHNNTTPAAIRDDLAKYLDDNDRMMVAELHNNAAWQNCLIDDAAVKALFTNNAK